MFTTYILFLTVCFVQLGFAQFNGDVRLVGTSLSYPNKGRAEVFYNGQWGMRIFYVLTFAAILTTAQAPFVAVFAKQKQMCFVVSSLVDLLMQAYGAELL